ISRVLLTVTADNQSKTYGAANPGLTVVMSGFITGEDPSVLSGAPALSTTADASSPVGSYPVTVTQGTLAADNYSFSFVDGSLSITKALLSVLADDTARAYGQTNPIFLVSFNG